MIHYQTLGYLNAVVHQLEPKPEQEQDVEHVVEAREQLLVGVLVDREDVVGHLWDASRDVEAARERVVDHGLVLEEAWAHDEDLGVDAVQGQLGLDWSVVEGYG